MFFVTAVVQFWSRWGLQITVSCSLAANLILGLFAGTRRRSASGHWAYLQWVAGRILWVAYQAADVATKNAIGDLSLGGSDALTDEQQLVAFWAPFLLLHLGGPDNMTSQDLEDNKLSARAFFDMLVNIVGITYAIYNYTYRTHSWLLLTASALVWVVGIARYVERVVAQLLANLDNMEEEEEDLISSKRTERYVESRISRIPGKWGERELRDDGEALLLLAQDLFPVWRRALVDSSVERRRSSIHRAGEQIFSLGWESMCAVVEMELSLMYELLYTKATVAHTWPGYLIRLVSPLATAVAAWLFWSWLHERRGRVISIRGSFVMITYLLLGTAIALDVVWLLRALASTWTYDFLKAPRPWCPCLHHQVLCSGRWRRFHRAVVGLDPLPRLLGCDAISWSDRCRRWSGTIGRYNLLRQCTAAAAATRPPAGGSSWLGTVGSWLATNTGLEEKQYLSQKLPQGVKKLLLQRVRQILPVAPAGGDGDDSYTMATIRSSWGQETFERSKKLLFPRLPVDELPRFGKEFEEDVLVWHIATCIFLSRTMVKEAASAMRPAIEAMSEYLMFLVAQRRQMLPGLILHSQLEVTQKALADIWISKRDKGAGTTSSHTTTSSAVPPNKKEDQLAKILREIRNTYKKEGKDWSQGEEAKQLLRDAMETAAAFTKGSKDNMLGMLDFIFNVWVDKLLYAGIKCSRESHAQQLSHGSELTTILWLIVHHAGPFRIGEEKPADGRKKKDQEEKKKKEEEEKKKKKEKEKAEEKKKSDDALPPVRPTQPPYPYPYPAYPYPYPAYPYPQPHPTQQPWDQLGLPPPPYETPSSEAEETEEHEVPEAPLEKVEEPPKAAKEPDDDDARLDAEDYDLPIDYVTLY